MRCPYCNRFVGLTEDEEPEVEALIDGQNVELTVRVVRNCVECGTELKEANLDATVEIDHDCREVEDEELEEELEFDLKEVSAEAHSRTETPKKTIVKRGPNKGKERFTPYRFLKSYYGAVVTGSVTCSLCNEEIQFETTLEEQASGFDELA